MFEKFKSRSGRIVSISAAPGIRTITGVGYGENEDAVTVPILAYGLTARGWTVALVSAGGYSEFGQAPVVPATCLFESYKIDDA